MAASSFMPLRKEFKEAQGSYMALIDPGLMYPDRHCCSKKFQSHVPGHMCIDSGIHTDYSISKDHSYYRVSNHCLHCNYPVIILFDKIITTNSI